MTQNNIQNINAHYSTELKASRPKNAVVSGPDSLPTFHLYNDIDAKKRFDIINEDIFVQEEKEKNKFGLKFLKVFSAGLLAILGIVWVKKIFK